MSSLGASSPPTAPSPSTPRIWSISVRLIDAGAAERDEANAGDGTVRSSGIAGSLSTRATSDRVSAVIRVWVTDGQRAILPLDDPGPLSTPAPNLNVAYALAASPTAFAVRPGQVHAGAPRVAVAAASPVETGPYSRHLTVTPHGQGPHQNVRLDLEFDTAGGPARTTVSVTPERWTTVGQFGQTRRAVPGSWSTTDAAAPPAQWLQVRVIAPNAAGGAASP